MRLKTAFLALVFLIAGALTASAVEVTVKMNSVSTTMSMKSKATGEQIAVGDVNKQLYTFTAPPGDYVITGYGKDGTTVNGTIDVCVGDSVAQQITVLTLTAYANNKTADGVLWTVDNGDYTIDVKVNSREGVNHPITLGNSVTAGRKTFLALNGDTYSCSFIPSEAHSKEGYLTLFKQATLTGNVNVTGAIPQSDLFTVTVPKDASFELNMKFFHFIDFTKIDPVREVVEGDSRVMEYRLAHSQVYNFRTSMPGKLTQGGYFTMSKDETKRPVLKFSQSDYEAFGPKTIKHDVQANEGFETGDIFVNVNKEGYLDLQVGDTFKAHAMRTWQLTENSTNNYFIEPDFHYTILDLNGKESDAVIKVEQKPGSAWADLKAVGAGTAIVLVTYDAIGLNFYNTSGVKQAYMGGEYWSAIWPENTAAYVITVGQGKSSVNPQILINEKHNQGALKLAGDYVDSEHDVFYYLDNEAGYSYTFKAEGAKQVKIAYPTIGEQMATYTGFGNEGVTANADGTFTVLLKDGRQIVQMTDAAGKSAYQVFTAKKCHREIVNVNRPGSKIFQPGDKIAIEYSGLRHPANKLSGIYNMSAYVTYNGVPNGTSLILSANQYKFGSTLKAQTVTLDIPADHDIQAEPELVFSDGVIQVNGYGDPIGNHRTIDPRAGRSPNFTAVPHKTYFGSIPDVRIPLRAVKNFPIKVVYPVEESKVTLSHLNKVLEAGEDGLYEGSYGFYDIVAAAPGNRCQRLQYNIADDAEGLQTFTIDPIALNDDWYGTNTKEPTKNENGFYMISSAAELAWFRDKVNDDEQGAKAILTADIDLGDYDWTPIGNTTSKSFTGQFIGNGHTVKGLYINQPSANYLGLFGCVKGTDENNRARICGITVDGYINGNMTLGGVVAYIADFTDIDACANYAEVHGARSGIGGIAGALSKKTSTISNCYNAGEIYAESSRGGIVGNLANGCDIALSNVFNVGAIENHPSNSHAIAYSTGTVDNITNAYAIADYAKTGGYTLVTEQQMASGEIAYRLGSAFGQKIGDDPHPVFSNDRVFRVTYSVVNAGAPEQEAELYSNTTLPSTIDGQEVSWYADEALTQPVTAIETDSRLYVKNIYTYTLTYVVDGETVKEETHHEGDVIVAETAPEKEGYTFSGWEGLPEVMPAADVTATASFTVNSYRLTLIVDNEIYSDDMIEYGTAINVETPEKEGHTFSGWEGLPEVMPAADVTAIASFTVNSYRLTIYLNNEVYKEDMVEYGAEINVGEPEIPQDCKFDGWDEEIPQTMPAHDVDIHGSYTYVGGIDDILIDSDCNVTVCTLSGAVLYTDRQWGELRDRLARGIYIVRYGNTVTTVYVK